MYKKRQPPTKKVFINEGIKAKEVRLIDEAGEQLGLLSLAEAIVKAKKAGTDLIQVTDKLNPPVCKIMDYGKYIYILKKKEKTAAKSAKGGELKKIRLSFGISDHDLETRVKQAVKFLKIGDKIMIEVRLKGREKAHGDFARDKVLKFIDMLNVLIPVKTERDLKRQPRGFTMIITKA
ncbi:translation initiation factor IF-3 [Patescibacteria group bacterium]|nr:translation initiation factor IF-3 [Patescibacteria group bacterium]